MRLHDRTQVLGFLHGTKFFFKVRTGNLSFPFEVDHYPISHTDCHRLKCTQNLNWRAVSKNHLELFWLPQTCLLTIDCQEMTTYNTWANARRCLTWIADNGKCTNLRIRAAGHDVKRMDLTAAIRTRKHREEGKVRTGKGQDGDCTQVGGLLRVDWGWTLRRDDKRPMTSQDAYPWAEKSPESKHRTLSRTSPLPRHQEKNADSGGNAAFLNDITRMLSVPTQ